ncbi:MAG: DnaJ domain-containing protein [Myxococcota bacterium]
MSAPEPIAQGNLQRSPLAHVLLTIHSRELDGTLAVWPDDQSRGQDRVLFEKGVPVAARLMEPAATLERGLLPLFRRATAPYAFYPADLLGQAVTVRGRSDPYALIAASLRGGGRKDIIERILGAFGEQKLRIKSSADLSRFQFIAKENAFLQMLRAQPQSVAQLVGAAGEAKVARRTLYLLSITQLLETFEAAPRRDDTPTTPFATESPPEIEAPAVQTPQVSSVPPATEFKVATVPPRSVPPRSVSSPPRVSKPPGKRSIFDVETPPDPALDLAPEHLIRWNEVSAQCVKIDTMNYFEMLAVERSASAETVRDAYFKQVKKWHPDRLAVEIQALKPWVETIFHHLTEAHRVLTDAEERKKYVSSLASGSSGTPLEERKLAAILGAAMEFRKVEVLIRRKSLDEALHLLDQILEIVPDDSDYLATRAYILFKQNGAHSPADRTEIMRCLDRAIEKNPRSERALMTKAHVLLREGKKRNAIRLFEEVSEINPRNLEAARQVRLAQMRGTSTRPPSTKKGKSKEEGLLAKFFGKKK